LNYGDTWVIINAFEANIKTMHYSNRFLYVLLVDGSVYTINILNTTAPLNSLNTIQEFESSLGTPDGRDIFSHPISITKGTWVIDYSFDINGGKLINYNTVIFHKITTLFHTNHYIITHTLHKSRIYKEVDAVHTISGNSIIKVFNDSLISIVLNFSSVDEIQEFYESGQIYGPSGIQITVSVSNFKIMCQEILLLN
jgi:hypothetical protein